MTGVIVQVEYFVLNQKISVVGRKGEPMSRYGDSNYDDMFYELNEFLKSHKPSELLKLVQDAVELQEEKDDRAERRADEC